MKKCKKIILIIVILISINSLCFAKYYEILQTFSGKVEIAEPIFNVKNMQDKKIINVDRNLNR